MCVESPAAENKAGAVQAGRGREAERKRKGGGEGESTKGAKADARKLTRGKAGGK